MVNMKRILSLTLFALFALAYPAFADIVWYSDLNQNTGTTVAPNVGATTCSFVNSPTWTTGKFGYGIDFDAGTVDYLGCGTSHIVSTTDWAFAAWIKLEGSAAYRPIVTNGDDDAPAKSGMQMYVTNTDKLQCQAIVGTDSGETATSTASVDETGNVWTHVGCKKVGTALTTWINGAQDGSATLSSATMDYTGDTVVFRFGSWAVDATNLFLGQMDELRVFNSDVDMAAIYAASPRSRVSATIFFQP